MLCKDLHLNKFEIMIVVFFYHFYLHYIRIAVIPRMTLTQFSSMNNLYAESKKNNYYSIAHNYRAQNQNKENLS